MIKKLTLIVLLSLPGAVWAAAAEIYWDVEEFRGDLENLPSLQNGMRLYMNYCIGCHSLKFQRYERTSDDLGIPHQLALDNLIFTDQKIGELMTTAMPMELSKNWFGNFPPDLTMITRYKSPEYVYNYLKTFYVDDSRPFGANNKMFPNVGMPNVLLELQGVQRLDCGDAIPEPECYRMAVDEGTGSMSEDEFDEAVYDLTNFLYYVGDPSRLERHRLGYYVLLFLIILGCFTYLLNREYWKDVH